MLFALTAIRQAQARAGLGQEAGFGARLIPPK
jgi:hypothetical protein